MTARHILFAVFLGTSSFTVPATTAFADGAMRFAQVQPRANSVGQADIQALRNQLQRQQFQQQQQIYREIDRQVVTPPQPVAPAIRQPCQSSANGGSVVGGCR